MEAHNNSEKNKTTFQVELVKSLLHWFKTDFFKWVNEPPCETCGVSSLINRYNNN